MCVSVAQTGPFSEDVSVTAIVSGGSTPGGGGGGGAVVIPKTTVRFSGYAYPNARVTVLEEGSIKSTILADNDGVFSVTFEEKFDKNILYSLYAKDVNGQRSILLNYPIIVYEGYLTHLSGIRFAPTIVTDKGEVKVGDYLTVSGYALPGKDLEMIVNGVVNKTYFLSSKNSGEYKITFPLLGLPKGEYTVHVKYQDDTRISKLVRFVVGENNVPTTEVEANIPGDCNADSIINLVDFSVLAFWYKKPNPPVCVDVNKDKIVDLIDFSILAYYWTG